jgi:hypothetical protein
MGSGLREVPAELVNHLGSERRQELIPDDLLRSLTYLGEVRRHYDPERPRPQRTKHGRMALEENAEFVRRRVGDHVDEHCAPFRMNADRETIGKIAGGPFVALPDGDVRQVRGADRGKRREMRVLLLSRPQPHHVRTRHDRVQNHETLDGMAECQRSAQTTLGLADGSMQRLLVQVIDARTIVAQSYIDAKPRRTSLAKNFRVF